MRRAGLRRLAGLTLLTLVASSPAVEAAANCGGATPCEVAGGAYRIELPAAGAKGALVFFHGHGASAEAQMGNRGLVEAALSRGLAFVAPDGAGGTWAHDGTPRPGRDDNAFVRAVLADLDTRFGLDGRHVILGGFSQGASMAWYTVCRSGDRVAGAVTFSGVFWMPLPAAADCAATPPPMIHFHGRADTVFPLAGRAIGQRWHQGDTFRSLAIVRERAGCPAAPPVPVEIAGIACLAAEGCARGPIVQCIHDGGHMADPAWLGAALDRLLAEAP